MGEKEGITEPTNPPQRGASRSHPDIETQRSYYDHVWAKQEFANNLQLARTVEILKALANTQLLYPKICDFGCGTGWLTSILAAFGPTTGIELSPEAIKLASQRYPSAQFLAADIHTWDPTGYQFDVVVSQEVLEHFEDHHVYLDAVWKILRPGGYLILTTPNADALNALEDPKAWTNQPIENWVTKRQLRRLLESRFVNVKIHSIVLMYGKSGIYRYTDAPKVRALMRAFGLEQVWVDTLQRLGYGLHFVATASKKA